MILSIIVGALLAFTCIIVGFAMGRVSVDNSKTAITIKKEPS